MHRQIMNPPDGMVVDHINHNGLNNRRSNLRNCTMSQNQCNQRRFGGKSKYKGVIWIEHTKKWAAKVCVGPKRYNLGCFKRQIDAARAYDKKARELHGEFACLNFPDEVEDSRIGAGCWENVDISLEDSGYCCYLSFL